MITIIHGDDLSASRNYYLSQKTKDAITFDGDKVTVTDLTQAFQGDSLFTQEKVFFLENFLTKRKASNTTDELIEFLKQEGPNANIFLWESKPLTKKQQITFPKAVVKQFSFPQILFTFLDGIKPDNGHQLIKLFHQTLQQSETELVFFMLIRHIRVLLALTDNSPEIIDEVKRLQPWQKKKLRTQSSFFTVEKLKKMLINLAQVDLQQKTGTLHTSLEQAVDFFLLAL